MATFKLYLLFSLLPGLSNLFSILGVIFALLTAISFAFYLGDNKEEDDNLYQKGIKVFSIPAICCLILYGIIPSKSDIFQIYIAKYVTTNKDVKAIPHVFLEYINSEIKKNEGDE